MRAALGRGLRRAELVGRLVRQWARRPDAPTRLVLDVTRRCNLRCKMCETWKVAPRDELAPSELRRILAQMPDLSWLDVTGGEPLLRRDAVEVFEAVLAGAPRLRLLHFQTNGAFEARAVEVCRRVRALRPDLWLVVTVSIDGPPSAHDALRGRAGSFDRALSTFLALRAMPAVDVYVGTTLTPWNAPHVDALGELLRARVPGFRDREWHWNAMQTSAHFFHNEGLPPLASDALGRLLRQHVRRRGLPRSLVDWMELVFLLNLEHVRRGEPSGVVCQALSSAAFLSPEGELYPCHVWDRPLGDLRARDVREVWGGDALLAARAEVERVACGGCFTPCEAYPALAGAPLASLRVTTRRALRTLAEGLGSRQRPSGSGASESRRPSSDSSKSSTSGQVRVPSSGLGAV